MTDLTTKTAQSLHDKWCEQMREKGFHLLLPCRDCPDADPYSTVTRPSPRDCGFYRDSLLPWPDLPESHRQEYLTTAKAVLPEIVGEVLQPIQSMVNTQADNEGLWFRAQTAPEAYLQRKLRELHGIIEKLPNRRLEELKK